MDKYFDVVVKTGSYQKNGETKARYENVGTLTQNEKGMYIILKRTFNPAGLPNPDNKDSCILSIFEKKPKDNAIQDYQGFNSEPINDDNVPF